jgi:AmiR/NasT family two-component response regulator
VSSPRKVILASADLNAIARVQAVVPDVVVVPVLNYVERLEGADLLILDLDEGGNQALEALGEAGDHPPVIAFLSHVDRDLGRAARAAGCRAISRGRFWSHLPELLNDPSS